VETQVKERLTGAVILVALVVLLVPELLTGPPRSTAVATSQAGEPTMRAYTIDLAEGGTPQLTTPVAVAPREAPAVAPVVTPRVEPALQEKPQVREPVSAPAASSPVTRKVVVEPEKRAGWAVQLGSFQSRDNARRLVRELKGKGFEAFILEGGGTSGRLYRVRVGPAPDRAGAEALATKLRQSGQPGSIVPQP
jgi:DedD protein